MTDRRQHAPTIACSLFLAFVMFNMAVMASTPSWTAVDQQHVLPGDRGIAQFAAIGNFSILAVTKNQVFQSDDSGNSWHLISDPNQIPPSETLAAVSGLIYPKEDIYAGGTGGLYKRVPVTAGTWQWKQVFYPGASITAIAQYPYDPVEHLFNIIVGAVGTVPVNTIIANNSELTQSADGSGWFSNGAYPPTMAGPEYPTSIVLQGKHCLIGSSGLGVYSSDDSGAHFGLIGLFGSRCSSVALIQDPNHGWYHYAATEDGLFRAPFANPQFTRIGPTADQTASHHATVLAIGNLLVCSFSNDGVYYSTSCGDDGSWQPLKVGFPLIFNTVSSFGSVGSYLLASVSTQGGAQTLRIDLSSIIGPGPGPSPPNPPGNLRIQH